ncbi:hypothetical protein C8J57DRAFT_1274356 [Mycena rebaudengoi]|nr:hypothetical protein C8J57DRAFT_1274356 [Mycena rebaudengoi]
MSQPRTISYALFFPALICNLVVIAAMVSPTTSAIQDVVYTDGITIGPFLGLIFAGLESLYLIIAIILAFAHVVVPSLAAILVDSLYLILCYLGGTLSLGLIIHFDYIGQQYGSCYYRGRINDYPECRVAWHTLEKLQLIGFIFQLLGLLLIIGDLVRVIRIRIHLKKKDLA